MKRIIVNLGVNLSPRSHSYRFEHCIDDEGTAKVTTFNYLKPVANNQSVYILLGAVHRIESLGKLTLKFIKVQMGSHFKKEVIIRYEDVYRAWTKCKGLNP